MDIGDIRMDVGDIRMDMDDIAAVETWQRALQPNSVAGPSGLLGGWVSRLSRTVLPVGLSTRFVVG